MISFIIPAYNEESNLNALYARLNEVSKSLPDQSFEFVIVDDGSTDNTNKILSDLRMRDHRVEAIRFARNCGSHAGLAAGLRYCRGDAAVILAADLQDPPELVTNLVEKWQGGFKIVWAVRKKREGEPKINLFFSRLYYALMNRLTHVQLPPMGSDMFLIDRAVIEAFKQTYEKNTSIFMLISWLGFAQGYVEYVKQSRKAGASKWNFSKRFKLFVDSVVSFSYAPLRIMSLIGIIVALLGFVFGVDVLLNGLFGHPIQGYTSLMIVVLILGGFQMMMLGMLGEYLWRTFEESRKRPLYVIEKNSFSEKETVKTNL